MVEITEYTARRGHLFDVTALIGTVFYRQLPLLPAWLNPWRQHAHRQAKTMSRSTLDICNQWIEDWPLDILLTNVNICDLDGQLTYGWQGVFQGRAIDRTTARETLKECFSQEVEYEYSISAFDPNQDYGGILESIVEQHNKTDTRRQSFQTDDYEPAFPEIWFESNRSHGDVEGIIRFDMSREQLIDQRDRAREHLRDNHLEHFDLHVRLRDKETSQRLETAIKTMCDQEAMTRTVLTVADNEPAVSLIFLLSTAEITQLVEYTNTIPVPVYAELGMPVWHQHLSEYMTDRFVTLAGTALAMDSPGIVNDELHEE